MTRGKTPSIKRLAVITIITTIIVLLAAAGYWEYDRMTQIKKNGGPGTQIVPASELSGDVYTLEKGFVNVGVPLSKLCPSDHAKRLIIVEKSKRILSVYESSRKLKTYFCALGWRPENPKTKRDDGKTPEGRYYVCSKNPKSSYELSLLLSYPNVSDAEKGCDAGLIDRETKDSILANIADKKTPPQDTALGSLICIHGGGIGKISDDSMKASISDWTAGCIALRSEDIKEVYDFGDPGTEVIIKP